MMTSKGHLYSVKICNFNKNPLIEVTVTKTIDGKFVLNYFKSFILYGRPNVRKYKTRQIASLVLLKMHNLIYLPERIYDYS